MTINDHLMTAKLMLSVAKSRFAGTMNDAQPITAQLNHY